MAAEARLAADHRALDALLAEGSGALEAEDAARAHRALDRLWMRLAVHIRAEHKALFPALGTHPGFVDALARLRADHDAFMEGLARILPRLKAESPDFGALRAELRAFEARLAEHNRIEETEVYPAAPGTDPLDAAVAAELAFLPSRYGD